MMSSCQVGQAPAPPAGVTAPVGAADGLTDAISTLSAAVAVELALDGAMVAAQAACDLCAAKAWHRQCGKHIPLFRDDRAVLLHRFPDLAAEKC